MHRVLARDPHVRSHGYTNPREPRCTVARPAVWPQRRPDKKKTHKFKMKCLIKCLYAPDLHFSNEVTGLCDRCFHTFFLIGSKKWSRVSRDQSSMKRNCSMRAGLSVAKCCFRVPVRNAKSSRGCLFVSGCLKARKNGD